ncbi:hypothetical protein SAMN05720761_11471 [Fibrobacter sp. UWCM]|uniref:hypothetical protein n=1 Tax=Fibrobacter sp. UWCM TaxID=1896208 RepID=UPI000920811D|nr:hypothetical protein [Fibrobacter sp. UWCM]SHH41542.1 hypothetical protein SAMN05720761_11471 [Fibrobacter sp. UWCM]
MEQSSIISFITANGVVIVIVLLLLLTLLIAFVALCVTEISWIYRSNREQADKLEEIKNSQNESFNSLIGVVRSLREDVEEVKELIDQIECDSNQEETKKYQEEMVKAQRNIVSYLKEQISPEQVRAYFTADGMKILNLVIENQNKFYSFDNVSLSIDYVESYNKNESEKIKKMCDIIDSVKNISVAPEEHYVIPLDKADMTIKEIYIEAKISITVHITITYCINNVQKEVSVELPLF